MIPYAYWQAMQTKKYEAANVCACACHPGPFYDRPQREEHSHYCPECNTERFTPWTELLELDPR